MKWIHGGVTAPKGFSAAAYAAGIKKKKLDVALLVSDCNASIAGAFTTNLVKAAPVVWDQHIVEQHIQAKAIVVNSGNANACTGKQGELDTESMATTVANAIGCAADEVLVCSTGVIGVPLPMSKIHNGITACAAALGSDWLHAEQAAFAICTTDTFVKQASVEFEIDGVPVRIGGMAKGSGMIHPNMATMLAFITTDAAIDQALLQTMLGSSVKESYNMISVDGDTSTNDTVLVMANGCSESPRIVEGSREAEIFHTAFTAVHTELAKLIVKDGEGAGKFIQVDVIGAPDDDSARLLARSVISSNLVKAAFFGADANWGRILCAMGYSGGTFDPGAVTVGYASPAGSITVLQDGLPLPFDETLAKLILQEKEITVTAKVGNDTGKATAWGCDLTYEYVRINGDYRS